MFEAKVNTGQRVFLNPEEDRQTKALGSPRMGKEQHQKSPELRGCTPGSGGSRFDVTYLLYLPPGRCKMTTRQYRGLTTSGGDNFATWQLGEYKRGDEFPWGAKSISRD